MNRHETTIAESREELRRTLVEARLAAFRNLADHYVLLGDLAEDLKVHRSNLRKYCIKYGFPMEKVFNPIVRQNMLALRHDDAKRLVKMREGQ